MTPKHFDDEFDAFDIDNDYFEPTLINRTITDLHPLMTMRAFLLMSELDALFASGAIKTRWRIFEGWRAAERQRHLYAQGASKLNGWFSPHQYGLAIDVAELVPGESWTWNTAHQRFAELHQLARPHGLVAPDMTTPGHLEVEEWPEWRKALLPQADNSPAPTAEQLSGLVPTIKRRTK